MSNKKDIKKMAREIFHHPKKQIKPKIIHPHRDWAIGVIVALVLVFVSGAWSVDTYSDYRNFSLEVDEHQLEDTIFREEAVKQALEFSANQADIHQQLLEEGEEIIISTTTASTSKETQTTTTTQITSEDEPEPNPNATSSEEELPPEEDEPLLSF